MSKLPNFVMMVSSNGYGSALRLVSSSYPYRYYRDGGDWYTNVIEHNDKLFSSSYLTSINGFELVPTTEEEWRISNGRYAPNNFKKFGYDIDNSNLEPSIEPKKYKYLLIRR